MIGDTQADFQAAFLKSQEYTTNQPATTKFPKGYGRIRRYMERLERCQRAYMWLTFRFDMAAADRAAQAISAKEQLASTGGVDPAQFPPASPIAYLKFSQL